MKLVYVLFTLLIAITPVLVEITDGSTVHDGHISLPSHFSFWKSESLSNRSTKIDTKNNFITHKFVPVVIISGAPDHFHFFSYYLPIYDLHRQKDFFLLI